MRKIILIAAITVASATASVAGPSRSLSLASSETGQPTAEPPKTEQKTEQKAELPPPTAERPKLAAPQEQVKGPAVADKPDHLAKPKRKHLSMEARVIYQLHRHGIYW